MPDVGRTSEDYPDFAMTILPTGIAICIPEDELRVAAQAGKVLRRQKVRLRDTNYRGKVNMDMGWFMSLSAEKEKTESTSIQYRWH